MPIHKLVRHIRTKSEATRKTIAVIVTAIAAVALFVLWGVSLLNKDFNITQTDINNVQREDFQTLQTGFSDIFSNAQTNFNTMNAADVGAPYPVMDTTTQASSGAAFDESAPYTP